MDLGTDNYHDELFSRLKNETVMLACFANEPISLPKTLTVSVNMPHLLLMEHLHLKVVNSIRFISDKERLACL